MNTSNPSSVYDIVDYTHVYEPIMQFNNNKTAFIHQWYPFVEGYSREFINNIIEEIEYLPKCALDPFAGSGTTPVELQNLGIKCYSFEVSPFMHLLAKVKLLRDYSTEGFIDALITVGAKLERAPKDIRKVVSLPLGKTFEQKEGLNKWIFNTEVLDGLLDIKYSINFIKEEKYQNLFRIAFASILLEVSNVYRNGKCLSYKKDWQKIIKYDRRGIHEIFLKKITDIIQPDIEELHERELIDSQNYELCYLGDVRKSLGGMVQDNTVDLIITSPPYLNSRDYTDIYIVELWMLDLVSDYQAIRSLRSETLRSHVQVKLGELPTINIDLLVKAVSQLEEYKSQFWNKELLSMIKGYFIDINILFSLFKAKMESNSKVYFNVANSAYYGVELKVDEIVASIAELNGFKVHEIRKARDLKTAGQQKDKIKSLRESVIVMSS